MSERKNVLLITYYWPPAGGAGVQRWLKMSKLISQHVNLTVYHPNAAHYPILDKSLVDEIPDNITSISKKIREPYALASKINPRNKNYQKGMIEDKQHQSVLSKISLWIRANFFIPDARSGWIRPSVNFLQHYLIDHPQDVIISTGPPHSMHVIGMHLKKSNPKLKWIADFRDPWTEIDYFDKLPLQSWALNKHLKLEQDVLTHADSVTTVSPSWAQELEKIGKKKVKVIFNGFDKDDFNKNPSPSTKFVITYIGSLNEDRNPSKLWKVLDKLCENQSFSEEFELKLIGNIAPQVKDDIIQYPLLKTKTEFTNYLEHKKAIQALQTSQILLLLINETSNEKGIIPGKFFEYLASERLILCVGKQDSDIANLLLKLSAGVVVDRNDDKEMEALLKIWFQEYQHKLLNQNQHKNIAPYSRKYAAIQFIQLIEDL